MDGDKYDNTVVEKIINTFGIKNYTRTYFDMMINDHVISRISRNI